MKTSLLLVCAALAACATLDLQRLAPGTPESEVAARLGKPVAEGRLASGEDYWDYTLQPYGYANYRVTFGPDHRVREVRNLLTPENFRNLREGMSRAEVAALLGLTPDVQSYGNRTTSWSYRYDDLGVIKLMHVIFEPGDRVQMFYSEWDPRIYSKDGRGKSGSR
jgi:outer membrane protein assembly factor BamE (lipoprotein component of BamABCDE complex)